MDLLEHQGKDIFRRNGLPVPQGRVVSTPEAAAEAAASFGGPVVLKAQVPVGGRGKAGGIRPAATPSEAEAVASEILGISIGGFPVRRLLVEEAAPSGRELYLAVILDRTRACPTILFSTEGGVDIEEVARTHPGAIYRTRVDPLLEFQDHQARSLLHRAGLPHEAARGFVRLVGGLYGVFRRYDCTLAEINPLLLTEEGFLCLDSKMVVDDSALFRQPEIAVLGPPPTEDRQERKAKESGLSYVRLEGEVGILGNGAGLVMATLDLVSRAGGKPANFLDVGGGARADQIGAALEIVAGQPEVRTVLVNIFGGITRCDEVANGLVDTLRRISVRRPLVVRFEGTNAAEGREILKANGLTTVESMEEAAAEAVGLSRGEGGDC